MRGSEEYQAFLPRSVEDGSDLRIVDMLGDIAIITDGKRTASYVRFSGEMLTGINLRILPYGIQGGRFSEANVVQITDGVRDAVFVPRKSRSAVAAFRLFRRTDSH